MKPLILVLVVALLFSACNRQADIRNEDAKAAGTEASTNTYNVDETTSNESSAGIISTYENSTEAFNETVTNAENETKNKYNSTFDSFATNTSNETANSAGFQASSNSSSLLESPVKEFIVYATDSTLSPYMMKANNGDSVRITFSVGISGVDYGGLAF